jgi:hypothetical protein
VNGVEPCKLGWSNGFEDVSYYTANTAIKCVLNLQAKTDTHMCENETFACENHTHARRFLNIFLLRHVNFFIKFFHFVLWGRNMVNCAATHKKEASNYSEQMSQDNQKSTLAILDF